MPTVHVEANLSAEQLLQAVRQLDARELEKFAGEILALRARRHAPAVGATEAELLTRINTGLPADMHQRYAELIARRQAETLTAEEHQELIRLGDQVEHTEAERLQALTALAALRQTSLADLMQQLGLNGKADG